MYFDKLRVQTDTFKQLLDEGYKTLEEQRKQLDKDKKLFEESSKKLEKIHFSNVVTLNIGKCNIYNNDTQEEHCSLQA